MAWVQYVMDDFNMDNTPRHANVFVMQRSRCIICANSQSLAGLSSSASISLPICHEKQVGMAQTERSCWASQCTSGIKWSVYIRNWLPDTSDQLAGLLSIAASMPGPVLAADDQCCFAPAEDAVNRECSCRLRFSLMPAVSRFHVWRHAAGKTSASGHSTNLCGEAGLPA